MRLVIDSNCVMAGLLSDSACRRIILSDRFTFYAPAFLLTELAKYRAELLAKSGLDKNEFSTLLSTLLGRLKLVGFEEFSSCFDLALRVMEPIDIKDSPFLAVGLALNLDGIWTQDKGFHKQRELKVHSTADLLRILARG